MLQVKDLTKIYKTKSGVETTAVNNLTADFGDRGLTFILGKSGCGKSTLLNLLGGLDSPTSGEIIVDGNSCKDFTEKQLDDYRNAYIGFIFQEYNLIPEYTVGENVALASELQGQGPSREEVDKILRQMELIDEAGNTLYERKVTELSGGQKQRVAIARALIKEPKIILADEPTGALDSETGGQLYKTLKALSEEKTIIVVTHDRDGAEKWGDRIIELKDGKILSDTASKEYAARMACEKGEGKTFSSVAGRLPFKRIFSMGINGLKQKKTRMILSVVLSVISFVIFGFSCVAAIQNENMTKVKTLYNYGLETVMIFSEDGELSLTEKQINAVAEYTGERGYSLLTRFTSFEVCDHLNVETDEIRLKRNPYLDFATNCSDNFAEISNPETLKIRQDERFENKSLCRLPQTYDEIAINDIQADMYMRFGYKNEDGSVEKINKPDDLIGKEVDGHTICGVYSTEQDKSFFEKYDIDNYDMSEKEIKDAEERYRTEGYLTPTKSISNAKEHSLFGESALFTTTSFVFVCKGYRENKLSMENENFIALRLSGNTAKDRKLFKALHYKEGGTEYNVICSCAYSSLAGPAELLREFQWIAFTVAGVFVVFCSLLTMNFLLVSLDFRKKEIGILRALGAGKRDVAGICLAESISLAVMNITISLFIIFLLSGIFNLITGVILFSVGFLPVFLTILLGIGVTALATILPLYRLTNKKPVDILNER